MYEIDPAVLELNDPRIIAYKEGKISQEVLVRLINFAKDPITLNQGRMTLITKEMQQKQYDQMNANHKMVVKKTGGLPGKLIYDNADKFLVVYPELTDLYAQVKTVITQANCTSCAANGESNKLLAKLLEVHAANPRDFSSLTPLISNYTLFIKILNKQEILDTDIPNIPNMMARNEIPIIDKTIPPSTIIENPFAIERKSCEDCCRKHVSNALLKLDIARKPESVGSLRFKSMLSACAELNEAADEIISVNKALADKIRGIRIKLVNQVYPS